ncbi:MAG: cobalamin-dependent protein [Planctomycetes bacterium]|nr:cobalamin-dependent protein [Planctomycetota bacterium]
MPEIVLATLNAKWIHASFGLRCLRANLAELRERSSLLEFEIAQRPADVAEAILAAGPRIVGLGVYVWNAGPSLQVVRVLKRVRPDVCIVLGGPEVSHETEAQPICALADHVVRGEADLAFADLCRRVLAGEPGVPRVLDAPLPHFAQLRQPYAEYTDEDVAHRIVYVESSRGCPFTCEFCLSALDVPVRKAEQAPFLAEMQRLLDRGVRHFKFVDRTFNLGIAEAAAILRFFRERWRPGLFVHFELIPDRLPELLRVRWAAGARTSASMGR